MTHTLADTLADLESAKQRTKADWKRIVELQKQNSALLEALKAMVKAYPDCLNDILNPCWDAARSTKQEYGKHWGGGQACAVCISKQAIAQAEGGA